MVKRSRGREGKAYFSEKRADTEEAAQTLFVRAKQVQREHFKQQRQPDTLGGFVLDVQRYTRQLINHEDIRREVSVANAALAIAAAEMQDQPIGGVQPEGLQYSIADWNQLSQLMRSA
jgi:hypothetical protein